MEFLNTIWNVLTAENEMLMFMLSIPFSVFEITLTTILFITILNIPATLKQKLLYIFSFSSASILSSLLIPQPFNNFINVILCVFLIMFIFKVHIFKSIIAVVIPNIIFIIVGAILQNLYMLIFSISTQEIVSIPIYRISLSLLIYLIVFCIYLIIKKFNINVNILDSMGKQHFHFLVITFSVGVVVLAIQGYIASIFSDILPFWIIVLNLSSYLIYFSVSFYAVTRTNKLEIATQDLEQSREYNKTLEILHDNIRVFKHDLSNIIATLGGYIQSGDLENLRNYYNGLQSDCNKINNLNILSPAVINEPAIYSLLTNKYHLAEGKGITVNLEIFIDLKELRIKVYEFTRILGILLDNAIEASSECEEKLINIAIRKDFRSEKQLLLIENTYKDKDINTEKIYEKGYSTKENNTGIGLWEVRQILKKNNNLNLFTSKNEKFFSQQLEIY